MISNDVLASAFNRSLIVAGLTGVLSILTSYQQGQTWEQAIVAGLIIAITAVIARLGLEGGYDMNRANNNNVNPGDVPVAAKGVDVQVQPGA
jgi:hypothetical protein